MQESLSTLSEKLEWLIEHRQSPDGDRYSMEEVAAGLRALGYPVTGQALRKLKAGLTQHPSFHMIDALACFFKVPLWFFTNRPILPTEQELLREIPFSHDPYIEEIALRVAGLSEEGKKAILALIHHLSDIERRRHVPNRGAADSASGSATSG